MSFTTLTIKDGGGASRSIRANDESGVGTGPYSFVTVIGDGNGTKQIAQAEDSAHASTDLGVMALAVRRDTPASSGADGDYVSLNTDSTGRLYVNIGSLAGSGFQAEDAGHTTADLGVQMLAVRRDTPAVGSNSDGDYSTLNVDDSGRLYTNIDGNTSHDAVDAGRPILLGARAKAHGASPGQVADDDRTRLHANRHGILWTIGGHPNVITRSCRVEDADGAQTDASLVGTTSSGTKIVITRLSVYADAANSGNVYAKVGFGASTIPASAEGGANSIIFEGSLQPGGGITMGDGSGVIAVGADGEELRLTCDDPAGGALNVSFTRYEIES